MPEQATRDRARRKLRQGKSASTAAGEYVREEMHHIRQGKHGARSAKQAIAIGLSKARRAGVPLRAPKRGPAKMRKAATRAYRAGQRHVKPSKTRSLAASKALRKEPHRAASHRALAAHATASAHRRGHASLVAAAEKAAHTRAKASAARRAAGRKAARTRAR